MRGQFFVLDFLFSTILLALIISVALHSSEFSLRTANLFSSSPNNAEIIAQQLVSCSDISANVSYCYQYSNGTGNETNCSSCTNKYVAQRLVNCSNSPCSLRVITCG